MTVPNAPTIETGHSCSSEADVCLNCGNQLSGPYCGICGQKVGSARLSVWAITRESAVELLGLDGRLWRTLSALLVRPGRLTLDYVQGRRAQYLRPLRVYLTSALSFFVLLSLVDPVGRIFQQIGSDAIAPDSLMTAGSRLAIIDSLLVAQAEESDSISASFVLPVAPELGPLPMGVGVPSAELDSTIDSVTEVAAESMDAARGYGQIKTARLLMERGWLADLPTDSLVAPYSYGEAARLLVPDTTGTEHLDIRIGGGLTPNESLTAIVESAPGEERRQAGARFARASISRIPTVMFFILPLFALILKLLYVRGGWYYSEHLVFALHAHSVAFIAFSLIVFAALAELSWAPQAASFLLPAAGIHFLLAQKKVYAQGWFRTLIKSSVLGLAYTLLLSLGLVAAVALAATVG